MDRVGKVIPYFFIRFYKQGQKLIHPKTTKISKTKKSLMPFEKESWVIWEFLQKKIWVGRLP